MDKEKKLQIMKAAVKRFAKHGLNKTTLDEIARDLRIGKATLYHYFESKSDLYYQTLDWEESLYIEDVKNIFIDKEKPMKERFVDYLKYKENLKEKYKLIYDIILLVLSDDSFENETQFVKSLIEKEEEILKSVLSKTYNGKIAKMDPALPVFFVLQSWGLLFENILYTFTHPGGMINTKEMIFKALENIIT